jgi:methionyl-tRNA formyltransferase
MHSLFITDNEAMYAAIREIVAELPYAYEFCCSPGSSLSHLLPIMDCRQNLPEILQQYTTVFSIHCRQVFPKELVHNVLCVNLHPGFNPANRGWYPHVFSIAKGMPAGATLHIMDEYVDHGPIIDQIEVPVEAWETSYEVYEKIQEAEVALFQKHFASIVERRFVAKPMEHEGNVNLKRDFQALCQLDLRHVGTLKEHLDLLRALTHGHHRNAYFVNPLGRKTYVSIKLEPQG